MLRKLKNIRGFSLVEVVVAAGIGGLLVSGMAAQLVSYIKASSDATDQEHLKRLVTLSVSEIESLPMDQLPPHGSCRIRKYDGYGKLLSTTNLSGSACGTPILQAGEREIAWIVGDQSTINVSFSHKDYLKLPTGSHLIKKVEIRASAMEAKGENIKTIFLTLFKG